MRHMVLAAEQVAILFVLIGAGVAASKTRMLSREGAAQLTSLAFYFATPCAIVSAFAAIDFSPELIRDLLAAALLAACATTFGLVVAYLLNRKEPVFRGSVLRMAIAFPNCGFMGIPLASALLGAESVAYLSMYMVVFHLFTWTAGVRLFRPHEKMTPRAMLLNPGVIGLTGGVLVLLWGQLGFALPRLVETPIESLAALNTPLAMLVMGFHVGTSSLRPGKNLRSVAAAIAARQILIPVVVLGASWFLGLRGLWFMASMVACVAPPAANTVMFAQKFNTDAPLGALLLTWANLAGILTMPLLLGICFEYFA